MRELDFVRDPKGRFVFNDRGLIGVKNVRTGGVFWSSRGAFSGLEKFMIDDILDPFRPLSVDEFEEDDV